MSNNTLTISPKFTIEDIHKVRENNYNLTKNMSAQEKRDYYNTKGMEVYRLIQEHKNYKLTSVSPLRQPLGVL